MGKGKELTAVRIEPDAYVSVAGRSADEFKEHLVPVEERPDIEDILADTSGMVKPGLIMHDSEPGHLLYDLGHPGSETALASLYEALVVRLLRGEDIPAWMKQMALRQPLVIMRAGRALKFSDVATLYTILGQGHDAENAWEALGREHQKMMPQQLSLKLE